MESCYGDGGKQLRHSLRLRSPGFRQDRSEHGRRQRGLCEGVGEAWYVIPPPRRARRVGYGFLYVARNEWWKASQLPAAADATERRGG
jgi:hypothetical protein